MMVCMMMGMMMMKIKIMTMDMIVNEKYEADEEVVVMMNLAAIRKRLRDFPSLSKQSIGEGFGKS